uniref:Uncharacterized protein n=1 Tax=Panagrolaimus davidi TaxID=227884 RepID=A0A914QZ91_9BILA
MTLIIGVVKSEDSTSTSTTPATSTTNEATTTIYEPFKFDDNETTSNYTTCSSRHIYSMPMIDFTKDNSFIFPLVLLLFEIFALLILRSIIAYYIIRRRLKKIYIFTHPPILDEKYFADPPPYAITKDK